MIIDAKPQIALIALGTSDYRQLPEHEHKLRRTKIEDMSRLRVHSRTPRCSSSNPTALPEGPPRIRRVSDLRAECAKEQGLPFLSGQYGVYANDPRRSSTRNRIRCTRTISAMPSWRR